MPFTLTSIFLKYNTRDWSVRDSGSANSPCNTCLKV